MSTGAMESALVPLGEHLRCDLCQEALKDRIKNLVVQWSVVKVRLFLPYLRWRIYRIHLALCISGQYDTPTPRDCESKHTRRNEE